MEKVNVKKHLRSRKNGKSVVKKHTRIKYTSRTHRIKNGRKEVFVDGFWKHDDYPNAPQPGWSYERLMRERKKLATDLSEGLSGAQNLPPRKYGLLTRRIKKIDRILAKKTKENL